MDEFIFECVKDARLYLNQSYSRRHLTVPFEATRRWKAAPMQLQQKDPYPLLRGPMFSALLCLKMKAPYSPNPLRFRYSTT